jgi:adsorption protein B
VLFVLSSVLWLANLVGFGRPWESSGALELVLWANFGSIVWRAVMRFTFTTREYGWIQGISAVLRMPSANIVAIMAGRRAFAAYVASLLGARPRWEKTAHHTHAFDLGSAEAGA